ncbi:S8 family serine peptidase [Mangrovivirga cuniculi]|uniref:Peptidase S8 n=1 Tax=Mangrovivirga cuniculi TaxID=2715131 RepID=A0A4D7JLS2_9BACT|nr:S8 family serine peptidase [Mangrovivirga cuniculi]QCK15833.1 peptidase S8 [Mangrovivirga cuniculi]
MKYLITLKNAAFFGLTTISFIVFGQIQNTKNDTSIYISEAPANWFNKSYGMDAVRGVETELAYKILEGKKSTTVIVAVIDSGVDPDHEDLSEVIWINEDEVAGNGIDDDGNGYIDDIHGWNFIGGKDENVIRDTYELTREYKRLTEKFDNISDKDRENDPEYDYFLAIKKQFEAQKGQIVKQYEGFKGFYSSYERYSKALKKHFDTDSLTSEMVMSLETKDESLLMAKNFMGYVYSQEISQDQLEEAKDYFTTAIEYGYNTEYNSRDIVGDSIENVNEKYYGNNDVEGGFAFHGTFVAGVIGAVRNNDIGIDGVADNVKIMAVRAVPNGDERDKDVANAIYYAVDNGARIINMSFGKSFSPNQEAVENAVKYAEANNVLLVHAAGNSSKDIDEKDNFPTRFYLDGTEASNWLEVGALNWKPEKEMVGSFSNYGDQTVDLFAPGVDIYSTSPDNSYKVASGTSFSAPVTSGAAAILMSYFPHLKASEVKDILVETATDLSDNSVTLPGSEDEVKFGELSRTGGVLNIYKAVMLAEKKIEAPLKK